MLLGMFDRCCKCYLDSSSSKGRSNVAFCFVLSDLIGIN